MSAATALHFAKKGKKTLIISTDPAHSLSDSFETKIGGEIKKLDKNLFALEIDPKMALQEYKEQLSPQIEKVDYLKGLGLDEVFDMTSMTPGIDEIASFDKFLRYMGSQEYDLIVFDTAPTGHALRFLSLPDVLDSWVGKLIKIRMRFSGILSTFKKIIPFGEGDDKDAGDGADKLEAMKERIKTAKEILSDPKKTHYNIVMIAEEMSIFESERSVQVLKEYRIPVESVIVNQLIPENHKCDFCTEKRKLQQERMNTIKQKFSSLSIRRMPLFSKEVKGMDMLEEAGKKMFKQ
jgi:arsenite-transporting ATPase